LPDAAREVTHAEALALGAVVGVALVGTVSLALAQTGRHDGWAALGISVVGGVGLVLLALKGRPRLKRSPADLVLVAVLGLLSLVMFLPGFPYAYADKDPGIYVVHAMAIAREGDVHLSDPVLEANLPGALFSPGARFPGVWTDGADDQVTPQFFHFFPALAATAIDLTDERAVFHLNALLGALSVALVALAARRAFGLPAAAIAGGLLAISLPQVWQAKYPSTEILAQLLMAGALLAAAIAAERRSPPAALAAGLLVGTGLLARPDGLLLLVLTIATGGLLLAFDRFDRVAWWGAAGLILTIPYATYNAYDLRRGYTLSNDVPDLPLVAAGAVAALAGGWAVRPLARRLRPVISSRGAQRRAGTAIAALLAVGLLVLANRERLFGEAYTDLLGPEPRRSYDEINLRRLTYYLTRLVPPLAVVGLAVVGRQRWRPARWIILVPGLCMTPLYLWEAQISPRMMWWVRRFVPGVVPVLLVLAAVAIAWALTQRRWALRAVGAAALVFLTVSFLERSLPIRAHREMGGSYEAAQAIAGAAGEEPGLFLWQRPQANDILSPTRNVAAVVWLGFDQLSTYLPDEPTQAAVDAYVERFPDRPVFVVSATDGLPGSLDPSSYTLVEEVTRVLPAWKEDVLARPQEATTIAVDVTVWRLDAAPGDRGA
jgi:hypothetical protein